MAGPAPKWSIAEISQIFCPRFKAVSCGSYISNGTTESGLFGPDPRLGRCRQLSDRVSVHDEVDCDLPGKLRGGEPLNGTPSRLTCRLVDFWIARAHDISGFGSGERSATQELMYLHSDLAARRVVPRRASASMLRQRMTGSPDPTGPGFVSECPVSREIRRSSQLVRTKPRSGSAAFRCTRSGDPCRRGAPGSRRSRPSSLPNRA